VLKAVNRKAAKVVAKIFKLLDDVVGHAGLGGFELHHDFVPIVFGRLGKCCEFGSKFGWCF